MHRSPAPRRALAATSAAGVALALIAPVSAAAQPAAPADADLRGHVVALADDVGDVAAAADAVLAPLGLAPASLYEHALTGFSVDLGPGLVGGIQRAALAANPLVAYVEQDRVFTTLAELPAGVDRVEADAVPGSVIGTGGRVDVDVAVIDTGSDAGHRDLDVVRVIDCYANGGLLGGGGCTEGGSGGRDDNGHGTHVAGTVGALDNGLDVVGVAPGARIWSVKVLGGVLGSGSTSDIIDGIEYVTATGEVEVVNMSLGGSGTSRATDDAIRGATEAGVVVVVAAGNDGADAAGYTPANSPAAITVSSFTDTDGRPGGAGPRCDDGDDRFASYSNFGDVVDLAAPGSCVVSTRDGGGTTSLSGTSMAAPHVAGAAALWIARNDVPATAGRRDAVLQGLLTEWSVAQDDPGGFAGGRSDERILLLPADGAPPPPPPPPGNTAPTVDVTGPADGTTVTEGTAVTFSATTADAEDGAPTPTWTSDRDGALGSGTSVTATLTVGTHVVTATVTDSAGATATDAVTVVVQAASPPPAEDVVSIDGIRFDDGSVLLGGRWVDAWITVVDADGLPVRDATVRIRSFRDGVDEGVRTATTGSDGEAYVQHNGVRRGCWSVQVLSVTTAAGDFDGVTPANEHCF